MGSAMTALATRVDPRTSGCGTRTWIERIFSSLLPRKGVAVLMVDFESLRWPVREAISSKRFLPTTTCRAGKPSPPSIPRAIRDSPPLGSCSDRIDRETLSSSRGRAALQRLGSGLHRRIQSLERSERSFRSLVTSLVGIAQVCHPSANGWGHLPQVWRVSQ